MNCTNCRSFVSFADYYNDIKLCRDQGFCVNRKSDLYGGGGLAQKDLLCLLHGASQRDSMLFGNKALGSFR